MNRISTPANNKVGCLIYCGDEQYRIRFYNPDKSFKDYDIKISDLFFKIDDEDAYLYEDDDKCWIDHSPSTLDIE
jgi:hypothetical protein